MSNKVSIKEIKAKVKASKQDTIKFTFGSGENTIDIEFKPMLSLAEESIFVDRVSSNVFDVDGNYRPEYKPFVFCSTLMWMLATNFTIPKTKVEDKEIVDFEEFKRWDSYFDFVETIYNANFSDKDQYKFAGYVSQLEDMVDDKIKHLKEKNVHKSKVDEFFDTLIEQVNKFSDKLKDIDMKQFAEDLHKISSMVGNVDDKTIVDEILKVNQKLNKDKVVDIKTAKK